MLKVVLGFPVVLLFLFLVFMLVIPLTLLEYFYEIVEAKRYFQTQAVDEFDHLYSR